MNPHDLLIAGLSVFVGLGIAVAAMALRRRAFPLVDAAEHARRRLNLFDVSAEVFDAALILIDGEDVSLVGGETVLAACAATLGLETLEASELINGIARLDGDHARRLTALRERGEACTFHVKGLTGSVMVQGRSRGAWAWLRLSPVIAASANAPDLERLRALIDAHDDPAWIASTEGAVVWANRAWLEAVDAAGVEEARATGATLDSGANALARAAVSSGEPRRSLIWTTTARGRRALNVTAVPLDDGGAAIWARDVTELQAARETSHREGLASARVLNHIADATAAFGDDGRLDFHNPAFAALWDFEPAWLAERPSHAELLDLLRQRRSLPETVDYARFKAEELARHKQIETISETIWRLPSDRTLRLTRLSRPGGGLTLIFSDITPELRLKTQFNHLIQVQRATLDKLSDAVAVFGADGRLRLHNEAFEVFWGIPAGQLQRTPDFEGVVELCIPRLHDLQFWRDLKGRITDPDPGARAPVQLELVTAERRIVAFQSRPLPDGATLIGFSDITDTRRLEEALHDREAALAEAERLKRAFVGSVSYELRTPLTTIIGYSELLERGVQALGEQARGYVGAIRSAAIHLARSISDVLVTAEIDAGEAVLEVGDVDVTALLANGLERRAAEARAAQISLTLSVENDTGLISGDGARLADVLDHLIENALRNTPAGGTVTLSAVRAPGEVCLTVSDNGRGFPFDVQAHIFDRFSSQNRGGPGLGLALVRSLVELHGGWVALESEPGAGATFTCHLPEIVEAPEARPRLF